MATDVFKILNTISPTYVQDLAKEKISNYNFRNKKHVEIPKVNSKRYDMKFFRYEAAQVWNSLPSEMRLAENICLSVFRYRVDQFLIITSGVGWVAKF